MLSRNEQAVVAQTVLLEAEGEDFQGKLAVAYVIMNRMASGATAYEVCWAPWQFSCWLPSLDKIAKRMKAAPTDMVVDSWKAMEMAMGQALPDPTHGATHYLNIELTKEQRGGTLPGWVDKLDFTVKIGQHSFYKEKR